MKVLILAAGYATRLYPLTLDKAKPLLPLAGKPMIEYIMASIDEIEDADEVFVVTNQRFYPQFEKWAGQVKSAKDITVVNDNTLSNDDRMGAIADMRFVIKAKNISDDLLIIGGDNLFADSLADFIAATKKKPSRAFVVLHDVKTAQAAKKYGVVEIDKDGKITDFAEKPLQPRSTLAAGCIYFYPKEILPLFDRYAAEGNNNDAPGNFVSWLCRIKSVYGYIFSKKWYDIGDINQYRKADKEMQWLKKSTIQGIYSLPKA